VSGVDRDTLGDLIWGWPGLTPAAEHRLPFDTGSDVSRRRIGLQPRYEINLLYSICEHLAYLHTITPALGGNWLTNCNSSLFDSALKFPEFKAQKQWLEGSKSSFETSLSRDFFPSGKEKEDTMMYLHIATGQLFWSYRSVRKAGVEISKESQEKLARCTTAWPGLPILTDRLLP